MKGREINDKRTPLVVPKPPLSAHFSTFAKTENPTGEGFLYFLNRPIGLAPALRYLANRQRRNTGNRPLFTDVNSTTRILRPKSW